MTRHMLANVIATIIAGLALLLGMAIWALCLEWEHHKRGHSPAKVGDLSKPSSPSEAAAPSRERTGRTSVLV